MIAREISFPLCRIDDLKNYARREKGEEKIIPSHIFPKRKKFAFSYLKNVEICVPRIKRENISPRIFEITRGNGEGNRDRAFNFFFFSILEIRKYFFQRILCRWIDKMYESWRKQCGNFAIGREGKECWKEGGEFFLLKRVASGNIQVALYQGSMDLRRDAFGNNLLRFARKSVRQESIRCGS